jgi:hypothetical protein
LPHSAVMAADEVNHDWVQEELVGHHYSYLYL